VLDMLMMLAYCEGKVLNTPHLADATSLDSRGFFASVVRLWPGSGQRKKSFRAETASRPSAVFKCLASPLNRGEIERYTLGGYMPKNQSAHLRVVEQTPINEATARLSIASSALDGFANLLFCYDNSTVLKAAELANLLEPIRMEVAAALDELRHVEGAVS